MPFKKTSLKARQRKKTLRKSGRLAALFGKKGILFFAGILIAIPGALFGITRRKRAHVFGRRLKIALGIIFVVGAFSIVIAQSGLGQRAGKALVKETIFALGAELPKDEHGFTNILLMGSGDPETHGAKGHKLTDSMMIASIDPVGRSVVLLSLPRDFYLDSDTVSSRVNSVIRDKSGYYLRELRNEPEHAAILSELRGQERQEYLWKLDAIADGIAEDELIAELENVFAIDIHRTARIDFRGFEKGVDAIGGIDVLVAKSINDTTYPDFEWGYDPFRLEAGLQHLDGATALKYARSRHDSSDFARAARQQQVISAIKDKLTSLDVLASPAKLNELYTVVQEHFHSDLSWEEIISLAEIGSKMPRENIVSYVLNNDPTSPGGFLVTPDRSLYGGAFVLVPFLNLTNDKYAQIRAFTTMIFEHRGIIGTDPLPITIRNGTKISGLAGSLQASLERYGWKISTVDNTEEVESTTRIRFTDSPRNRAAAELLTRFMAIALEPVPKASPSPLENGEVVPPPEIFEIIIGTDYSQPYRSPLFPDPNGQ